MVTAWSALIVSGKDREIDQQGRLYIRDTHHLIYLLLGQRIGPSGRRRNCVYRGRYNETCSSTKLSRMFAVRHYFGRE